MLRQNDLPVIRVIPSERKAYEGKYCPVCSKATKLYAVY